MKIKKLLNALAIILILTTSCKTDKKNDISIDSKEIKTEHNFTNDEKQCFMLVIDSSYKKDGEVIKDNDYVSVNLTIKDKNVEGEYIISSKSTKNKNGGTFVGTINNNIIDCIHTYKKGDKFLKDELVFKLETNQISILGGEKKLENGINIFVDKNKCDYMMQIPRINCN